MVASGNIAVEASGVNLKWTALDPSFEVGDPPGRPPSGAGLSCYAPSPEYRVSALAGFPASGAAPADYRRLSAKCVLS